MSKLTLALILFVVAACSIPAGSTDTSSDTASDTAADLAVATTSECNFQTALIPGVPGSPGNLIKSSRNPNGDSELADLMRTIVDDLREVRGQLDAGEAPKKLLARHRRIRCSWPTDLSARNETFDLHAQGYLAIVDAFDKTPSSALYNAMITGCVACHQVTCPGPLELISQLKL